MLLHLIFSDQNNVQQPTFRPSARPSFQDITTTVVPTQTFRPRPEVTFAPRPAVTFAPRPAVTFAPRPVTQTFAPRPQIVQDSTTRAPLQPRPEVRPNPTPGSFRQSTDRPATKGDRRPQQPLGPVFQPRPIQTTKSPVFRDVQTVRPFPTPTRPVEDTFDTEEPEEVIDQEDLATSSPAPIRPTLPPRRPQSTFAPRPTFQQR